MNWSLFLDGLLIAISISVCTWLISLIKKDVSIVDTMWSIMILAMATVYLLGGSPGTRELIIFGVVLIWALRLSIHITVRSWGEAEDRRYQDIRKKYSPKFEVKSLFIIFIFQAALAWVISMPLNMILINQQMLDGYDVVVLGFMSLAIIVQSIADYQLYRFKSDKKNKNKVFDKGLWAYSRHPNYFAEFVIWWCVFLLAVPSGEVLAIISPLLMSFLLLKFSGVGLMEEDIHERRPAYYEYKMSTNAFFPGPRKKV